MSNITEILEALWPQASNRQIEGALIAIEYVSYCRMEKKWYPSKDQLNIIFSELLPSFSPEKQKELVSLIYNFLKLARSLEYTPDMAFYGYTD